MSGVSISVYCWHLLTTGMMSFIWAISGWLCVAFTDLSWPAVLLMLRSVNLPLND